MWIGYCHGQGEGGDRVEMGCSVGRALEGGEESVEMEI